MTTTKATLAQIKTLKLRIESYRSELATCTTSAMRRCVLEQIDCACQELIRAQRSREV